jgi:hypothetical protein
MRYYVWRFPFPAFSAMTAFPAFPGEYISELSSGVVGGDRNGQMFPFGAWRSAFGASGDCP